MQIPDGFRSTFVHTGDVRLHVVTNSADPRNDTRPTAIFLHGFPEFWIAWEAVFTRLAERFLVIAPDQRGYNLSDAPQSVSDYEPAKLVGDLIAAATQLIGERRFLLCGHDWGASIAYAAAFRHPQKIAGLVIANGVHPVLFQRALLDDPDQRKSSQYFHYLRAPDAAEKMSADGFRRTFGMFEKFSPANWLTPAMRVQYAAAWGQPGRLNAMLNWYRASPIVVPRPGETSAEAPLLHAPAERFQVRMPHLLIWGSADVALRPSSHIGLEDFAPKLRRIDLPGADHWLLHSHARRIADEIAAFAETLDWSGSRVASAKT